MVLPVVTTGARRKMQIGDLSEKSGVNIETIRYYERIGVLPIPARMSNGRRTYGEADAQRLCFIRNARNLVSIWHRCAFFWLSRNNRKHRVRMQAASPKPTRRRGRSYRPSYEPENGTAADDSRMPSRSGGRLPDHRRHGGRKTLRLTSKLCWQTSTDSSGGRGPASGCCPASRCRAADCRKASASVLSGPSLLLELDIEEHGLRGETHAISIPDAVAQRQAVGVVGLLAWLN